MAKSKKVPVSLRAVIQLTGIRQLAADNEVLKVSRGERLRQQVGDYYVLNYQVNGVMHHDVDPEEMGRKLGVLQEWEQVV